MYPWQQQIFDRITSGGIKPGEMICMTAGRNVGKSVLTDPKLWDEYWLAGASSECEDGVWHSVVCFTSVAAWIRAQDPALWIETSHPSSMGQTFDIADSLFLLLNIRWSRSRA